MVRIDPKYPKRQKTWVLVWATRHQLAMGSPRELHHTATQNSGFSSRENHPFSHQNPIFDPIDPKFDPKTYTLDYRHIKAFKTTTYIELKHQFISKSSSSSFSPKTTIFLISHSNFKTTTPIQNPSTYKHK